METKSLVSLFVRTLTLIPIVLDFRQFHFVHLFECSLSSMARLWFDSPSLLVLKKNNDVGLRRYAAMTGMSTSPYAVVPMALCLRMYC